MTGPKTGGMSINDKTLREWIFNVKRILFTKKGKLEAIQAQDPVMFVLLGGGISLAYNGCHRKIPRHPSPNH